ncbi:hypothetical protein BJX63DRAFT_411022 [Aspergillus granulosus]|uniref:UBP-type domain-containing protein n=1 Tax=Aspergillus granulosus TaxID=176169 RepID=A0ABR4GY06_9EURO
MPKSCRVHIDPFSNSELDHCTACQIVSGQICIAYYLLKYCQSDNLSRYSCKTCGSHAFAHSMHSSKYSVAVGLPDNPPQTKGVRNWGTDDTPDGGLSSFLPGSSADNSLSCWLDPWTSSRDTIWGQLKREIQGSSQLLARCHCGGIELYIPALTTRHLSNRCPLARHNHTIQFKGSLQRMKWM